MVKWSLCRRWAVLKCLGLAVAVLAFLFILRFHVGLKNTLTRILGSCDEEERLQVTEWSKVRVEKSVTVTCDEIVYRVARDGHAKLTTQS